MLRAPLLFSREQDVYYLRVVFWRQAKASEFSTSQKWLPRDRSVQCLMGYIASLKGLVRFNLQAQLSKKCFSQQIPNTPLF